jgi:hypothetical protein
VEYSNFYCDIPARKSPGVSAGQLKFQALSNGINTINGDTLVLQASASTAPIPFRA